VAFQLSDSASNGRSRVVHVGRRATEGAEVDEGAAVAAKEKKKKYVSWVNI
jgi:hypothetical protein